ncbi:unnamed protein product [Tuber melanosporum]|uniref:(Perigord truffle) hypothetical protein n=1 Tax=Tuber melanosporum (strain Mel28) TaxID=656061 RepID=D5GB09_TUBMM|nr:uncharacterized protein GSTUM_00005393001 [Tuber melanosporum]CAZ81702.1 unnamed protein product [Tuber melanosporum]
MADTDAAKAEKIAAAKRRFEQLKKQKGKKKGSVTPASTTGETSKSPVQTEQAEASEAPSPTEGQLVEENAKELAAEAGEVAETPAAAAEVVNSDASSPMTPADPESSHSPVASLGGAGAAAHSRAASIHARRQSASGFRRPSITAADIVRSSNKSPLSPGETVPDIYRKQATTISELTESVERLEAEVERLKEKEKKLSEVTVQKDEAQETLAGVKTELKEAVERAEAAATERKAREEELEKLKSEVATLTRQMSHLTSQISQKDKAISDLKLHSSSSSSTQDRESLTAKEDQIENMEMDISKLRGDLERANKSLAESQSALATAEGKVKGLEESQEDVAKELEENKKKLDKAAERLVAEGAARSSAETKITSVQAEFESASATVKSQAGSISSWEKDYNTLKTMYRDTDMKGQESQKKASALERENKNLTTQVLELRKRTTHLESENATLRSSLEKAISDARRGTGSMPQDDELVDELEDDGRKRLEAKVRQLEQQLQQERSRWYTSEKQGLASASAPPRSTQQHQQEFLDVDLNAGDGQHHPRGGGNDHLYAAQMEEERRQMEAQRLERIKEVKRGLANWKGWRLDMTAGGGYGVNFREMFEV